MDLISDEDYYDEDGLIVMTATYHMKRGQCCGSGCRWCPYEPRHQSGATTFSANGELWLEEESPSNRLKS
jgi:hypothetical protein